MTDVVAIAQRIQSESKTLQDVRTALQAVIVGQDALLDGLMIALLADGHVLLEGLPTITRILAHLGLPTEPLPVAPAREPPQLEFAW